MKWLDLSDRQQKTVAAALTMLSGLFILGVLVAIFVGLIRFLTYFSGVFMPLAVAGVLALVTRPYFDWLARRLRYAPLALAVYFASLVIPLGLFVWFLGSLLVQQVVDFLARIPAWLAASTEYLKLHIPAFREYLAENNLDVQIRDAVGRHIGLIATGFQLVATQLLSTGANLFRSAAGLLGWLICPVYLAFMLLIPPPPKGSAATMLPFLKPETREDVMFLGREFVQIIINFFRGQVIVATIQGVLYAIAFVLVGVPYGLAIGLLMGLLNIVPYLGSAVGLVLSLALSWGRVDGHGGLEGLAFALGAFLVVQGIESYFITPRIMGKKTGLHPMAIMVAMFFWGTALGGILGILLAVPLTAFLVVLWRLLKAKYIRAIV
jgi:predicted PurR-regulated permease PerM